MNDKSYPSSMESNCSSAAATATVAVAAAAPHTSQLKRSSGGGDGGDGGGCATLAAMAMASAAALLFTCVPTSTSLLYWHPLLILVPRESNNQASAGKQRKLTHQKRQRVYISSPKSLRSTFTSSQPAIKQSRTTTNRRDPLWVPFSAKKLRKKTQGSRSCKDTLPWKVFKNHVKKDKGCILRQRA